MAARLGVAVAWRPPPRLGQLLLTLRRWCLPVALDSQSPAPDAWLFTAPAARERSRYRNASGPTAVWVSSQHELAEARSKPAALLITHDERLAVEDDVQLVPDTETFDSHRVAFYPPFVRTRLRERGRLGSPLVLDLRGGRLDLNEAEWMTALSVCSAAVVDQDLVLPALARGTPVVTTPATARRFGLRGGVEVVVARREAALDAAEEVAGDVCRSAALSLAGRQFAERRHDLTAIAVLMAERLGLVHSRRWRERVDLLLEELNTPLSAPVRLRAATFMHALDVPP